MDSGGLETRASLQSANDFNRYVKRLSRRAKTLRKRAGTITKPHKGQRKDPPSRPSSAGIASALAERCWAQAREAQAALAVAPATSALTARAAAKFAKASKYAALASTMAPDSLEIAVHSSLIDLSKFVERRRWSEALAAGSDARLGLLALAASSVAGASDCVAATVDPALRLALGHTDPQRTVDIPEAAKMKASEHMKSLVSKANVLDASSINANAENNPVAQLGGSIKWRSHVAPVKDADLAGAILHAKTLDESPELGVSIEAAESVLQAWSDAQDALEASRENPETADSEETAIIRTYLWWRLLLRRVQRDDVLASASGSSCASSARLFDAVLQSVTQLSELPGVHSDSNLVDSLSTLRAFYASKRLSALAHVQSTPAATALALLAKAQQMLSEHQAPLDAEFPVTEEQLNTWRQELKNQVVKAHGRATVYLLSEQSSSPVSTDLRKWPSGNSTAILGRLADLKGTIRPVPVKPVFYDVAFNHVSSIAHEADEPSSSPDPNAKGKKSLFGLFK